MAQALLLSTSIRDKSAGGDPWVSSAFLSACQDSSEGLHEAGSHTVFLPAGPREAFGPSTLRFLEHLPC